MLEAALTLSVFIFMLMGVFDVGLFVFLHETLTERVRGAARSAAIKSYDTATIQNIVVYGSTTAPTDTTVATFFGLSPSNVFVTVSDLNTNAARLSVTVSGLHYMMFSPLLAGSPTNLPVTITVPLETP